MMQKRKRKTKSKTAASRIAKLVGNNKPSSNTNKADLSNLRRSTRKQKAVNLEDYTDSSGYEDEDIMRPPYRTSRNQMDNNISQDELSFAKDKKVVGSKSAPWREGLQPRCSKVNSRQQLNLESEDEHGTSEEKVGKDEAENGNDVEDIDAENGQNEGDGEDEGDGDGDDDGEEDGDNEEGEEEHDGRRRYDLRNRAYVRRFSMEEGIPRPRSPRRVLHQGMGTKVSRDVRKSGSRVHKCHRITRAEDSNDSLLVDELDQGPAIPWGRSGSRSAPPWLFGGLEMHGTTTWGLNVAASGWVIRWMVWLP